MAFNVNVVPLSSGDTVISELGVSVNGSVHGLVICNNNATERPVTLKLYDASEGITSVFCTATVPANSQFTWPKAINLEAGDSLIGVGPDLIALQSTYVGVAIPAAQGFTGRGAWSSLATYQPNDVVSYDGSSYVANVENTDSEPPSADWTLLAAQGEPGTIVNLVRQPTAISPVTGGLSVPPNGPLVASPYAAVYASNVRAYRRFQVTTPADTTFASPVFSVDVDADSTFVTPILTVLTNYIWRCKDVSVEGDESPWMTTQAFTTLSLSVVTPTVSVTGAPSNVSRNPTISLSAFQTTPVDSPTYLSTNWEVRKSSDNSLVFSSYNDQVNTTSISVPPGILEQNTSYIFRGQYNSTIYGSSTYGSTTASTIPVFGDVLYDPLNNFDLRQVSPNVQEQGVAVMDATTSVFVYAPRLTTQVSTVETTMSLGVATMDTATQTMTCDPANLVTVSANVANQDGAYSICALTSTTGVVVWRNYFEGTGSGTVSARIFSVSGGVVSLVGSTTTIRTVTTTARNYYPYVFRLNDSTAIVKISAATSAASVLYVLTIIGNTITVNTTPLSLPTTDVAQAPFSAVARDSTRFVGAFYSGATTSKVQQLALFTVSGTGTAATIAQPSTVNLGAAGSTAAITYVPIIVGLTAFKFLVKYTNAANATAQAVTLSVTDGSVTVNSNTLADATYPIFNFPYSKGFFRVNDTSAIFVFRNGLVKYTWTSDSAGGLSIGTGLGLTDLAASGYFNSYYQPIPDFSTYYPSPEYFVRHGVDSSSLSVRLVVDRYVNASNVAISGTVIMPFSNSFTPPNAGFPYYKVISPSRALSLAYVNDTDYTIKLQATLLNISGAVPVKLFTQNLPLQNSTWEFAVEAFTTSRIVIYQRNNINLYDLTDSGLTLLDTEPIPTGTYDNATVNLARIDGTRIVYSTVTATPQAVVAMLTLSGNTLVVGSLVQASTTPLGSAANYNAVAVCSTTRGMLIWQTGGAVLGSILSFSGNTISIIAAGTTILASGLPTNRRVFLDAVDETRYIYRYVTSALTLGLVTLVDNTTTITVGGTGNIANVSSTQLIYQSLAVLSPTRGVVLVEQTTPDAITIYPYTLGAGGAAPAPGGAIATVRTPIGSTQCAIDIKRISDLGPDFTNQLGALVIVSDQYGGAAPTGTGFNQVRKFLRAV